MIKQLRFIWEEVIKSFDSIILSLYEMQTICCLGGPVRGPLCGFLLILVGLSWEYNTYVLMYIRILRYEAMGTVR